MGNTTITKEKRNVSFSEKDKIIEFQADSSPGQDKPLSVSERDTDFTKKIKPRKRHKEACNLFWEDSSATQSTQSEGGHRRLVRQSSQPVLWVTKEEPLSQRTLDELKKIGKEFAELAKKSKSSGFEK